MMQGQVTFFDVIVEYDNQVVSPTWTTSYVDDVCNNRAHVLNETTSTSNTPWQYGVNTNLM
jgi:hypothetical protein